MNKDYLKGKRTYIVAAALALYAVASYLGVDVPEPDGEQSLAISGILMFLMRKITTTPPGSSV